MFIFSSMGIKMVSYHKDKKCQPDAVLILVKKS